MSDSSGIAGICHEVFVYGEESEAVFVGECH